MFQQRFLVFLLFLPSVLFSQSTLKTMFYNVLEFPEANPKNREIILQDILNEYRPDIFMICELQSNFGADLILNTSLNTTENLYDRAAFVSNQSGEANLQQMLFFRKDKFFLEAEEVIETNTRDINHYTLKLSTADIQNNPILIEIFVTHLKSSQGGSNEQERLNMVEQFTSRLESLDSNSFVIFAGDFNLYSSTEPAYIELLDPTNAIVMVDPIDTPGAWSGNANFQDIHTQSTRESSGPFGAGAGGGLDDRFDFILVSENMLVNPSLRYLPDTYKAYGNNGNCFDLSINDTLCNGIFSESLRDNLYYMSDHLPVVMDLETAEEIVLNISNSETIIGAFQLKATIINNKLELFNNSSNALHFTIINTQAQVVKEFSANAGEPIAIDVSYLSNGVYFLTESSGSSYTTKFLKL